MSFVALIVKNLVRQRIRTGLTVLGISLGITTVVALGVVTNSLRESMGQVIRLGDADFMVAQEGAADITFSIIPEDEVADLGRYEGVARAEGVLFHMGRVGSNPFFFLMGRSAEAIELAPPPMIEGRVLSSGTGDEVMLGERAANDLNAAVGDTVTIEERSFTVVGVYRTGRLIEDSGAYAPLATVQEITAKPDVVTAAFVKSEPGVAPADLARNIEASFQSLVTISNVDEYGKVDQGVDFLEAANLAISVLAVGIGAIGVMNTMVMSVLERTREIGILRAVGWSGRRVLRMIVGESIVLCILAAAVGTALGVLATRGVLLIDTVRNLLEPQYTLDIFVRALVVAVVVALLGAIYPAFRAVRLTPMEALRYE